MSYKPHYSGHNSHADHYYEDPKFKTEKKIPRPGDPSREQAKLISKMPFDQPTMWNHRLINNSTSWELWRHQTPKRKEYYLYDSPMYIFMFGTGRELSIDFFLQRLTFGKVLNSDGKIVYFLDNITLDYHGYSNMTKNYKLDFFDSRFGLDSPKTLFDKVVVAKLVILIMNECDPEEINYTNYGDLVFWYTKNAPKVIGDKIGDFGPVEFESTVINLSNNV